MRSGRPGPDAGDDEDEAEGSQKAPADKNKNVENTKDTLALAEKDHFNRLVGPITVNFGETTVEQVYESLEALLKTKEKPLFEYFNAGFELYSKYKPLEKCRQLNGVHDWRQLVIKKKEPLPPPEPLEGDDLEAEGDQENQED